MKKIIGYIFLVISLLVITYMGIRVFGDYLAMHKYYASMISNTTNRWILIRGLVGAAVPTCYLLFRKKASLRGFCLSLLAGVVLYMWLLVYSNTDMIGFGPIKLVINALLIFGLGFGFVALTTVVGSVIKQKLLRLKTETILDVVIDFGVGLSAFLLIQVVLMMSTLYYPIVNRLLVAGAGFVVYKYKTLRSDISDIVTGVLQQVSRDRLQVPSWAKVLVMILLVMTFWYIVNGYLMAYMPYSTAWDANHAYMFYPKMWALNHGLYWFEAGMVQTPFVRYGFIAFWFSLFQPFGGLLGIGTDTIAIEMNYFSALYVLILGIALAHTLSETIKETYKHVSVSLGTMMGWLLMLVWLMSGMGSFLVFVDNKTDLGVMALIMLAMLSGFVFLKKLITKGDDADTETGYLKYIGLSGFFYGIAVLAKPTALFDVANFGLYMRWIWFGVAGVVALILLVIGGMSAIEFRGIKEYIEPSLGKVTALIGGGGTAIAAAYALLKQGKRYFKYMLVWLGVLLATVLVIKVPYNAIAGATYDWSISPQKFIERVFFAQTSNQVGPKQCSLASLGLTSTEELYDSLTKPEGNSYNEDVGRYVGFGWKGNTGDQRRGVKPFVNPLWAQGFDEGCTGFNPLGGDTANAKILCETEDKWTSFNSASTKSVLDALANGSPEYVLVNTLYQKILTEGTAATPEELRAKYTNDVQSIKKIMEDNTVRVLSNGDTRTVYFPYKFLNPLNITYNWSLQNESSYYTDIGVVWLILMVFSVIGLVYGLLTGQRHIAALSGVTVFGRILRWLIGGGIVWYAIGIIIWSILAFIAFILSLVDTRTTLRSDPVVYGCCALFIALFCLVALRQQGFNMIRIASQTTRTGQMFQRYRANAGLREGFNERLQAVQKPTSSYGQKDVFDRQFGHYNAYIATANESKADEGSWIAGTYVRYFIENQTNVKYDQFILWMGRMISDQDPCATYLRLQDQGIRYMAIDPNIGTVVQGEGNKSLFYRFFGKTNLKTGVIEGYGALTMFTKMIEDGYVRLLTTNNIGAKYALTLPDSTFVNVPVEQRLSFKARMSSARYFGSREKNRYVDAVVEIADARMKDGMFVEDLAWMLGIESIRTNTLLGMIQSGSLNGEALMELTEDERTSLNQFMYLRQLQVNNPGQYKKTIRDMITRSIYSPNQIVVYELIK